MKALAAITCFGAVLGASAVPAFADPQRCTIDVKRYGFMQPDGWGEALLCDGKQLTGVSVRFSGKRLTGVHWIEQQDGVRKRHTYLYDDGTMAFIAHDQRIKSKSFYKQTRGTKHYAFPRSASFVVAKEGDRVFIRDRAGRIWVLQGTDVSRKIGVQVVPDTSWQVESLDGVKQQKVAIDFSVKGIVATDFVAAKSFFLETKQPDLSGLADRRSTKFREMKSVFHDGKGGTCAVANKQIYGGSPRDPDDKSEYELLFPTDGELDEFLTEACPKLDRGALSGALSQ